MAKPKIIQAKYRCKKGCGCKMCKAQKGGWENRRTVRDTKLAYGHLDQLKNPTDEKDDG